MHIASAVILGGIETLPNGGPVEIFDPEAPIFGKTGTCTDERSPTHLGWFGSFSETGRGKLAVTVLLTGGRGVSGPAAAGVASRQTVPKNGALAGAPKSH